MASNGAADELDSMGPVDFLVAEYPEGRLTGEAFPYLMHLVDTGIIHILDLTFVAKDHTGMVRQLDLDELPEYARDELELLQGASSGLLGPADVEGVGDLMKPGCIAAILVFENLWAAPFASAMRRTGAQLVAHGRIPVTGLLSALDAAESTSEGAPAESTLPVPPLLRGVARTSVIAATAVSLFGRFSRLHSGRWAEHDATRANRAREVAAHRQDAVAQLTRLADLRTLGMLTEAEFEVKIGRVLDSNVAYWFRPNPEGAQPLTH